MFAIACPVTHQRSLVGMSQILSVDNGPQGIAVLLRCHCGRRAVWLTGRDRSEVLRHEASPRTEDAA